MPGFSFVTIAGPQLMAPELQLILAFHATSVANVCPTQRETHALRFLSFWLFGHSEENACEVNPCACTTDKIAIYRIKAGLRNHSPRDHWNRWRRNSSAIRVSRLSVVKWNH